MAKYLIDTSIFISHLRQHQPARDFLEKGADFVMSFVTAGELLQGVRSKKDLLPAKKLIDKFEIHWGAKEINQHALELLEQAYLPYGTEFLDALQASIAISANLVLVTDNIKHFKYIPNLQVERPPY